VGRPSDATGVAWSGVRGRFGMPSVIMRCPRLGTLVFTGVALEAVEFERLGPRIFRMRCSACGSEHVWSQATAWLSGSKAVAGGRPNNVFSASRTGERISKSRGDYVTHLVGRLLGNADRVP
jgi:hypothetical protein